MENSSVKFCTKCGQQNLNSSKYCSKCGQSLIPNINSNQTNYDNMNASYVKNQFHEKLDNLKGYFEEDNTTCATEDMVNYIQKNNGYYILKFRDIETYKKTSSWNWASFFFNYAWLFYRKMYLYGSILLIVQIILNCIPVVGFILNLVASILCGLFGNFLYLNKMKKDLNSLKGINPDIKHRAIIAKGGTNTGIVIAIILLSFVIGCAIIGASAFSYGIHSAYPRYYYY